jgi:hypothetical protein
MQAEILGQPVTWLVPHQLAQVLPVDVDYRVMLTFLEFYETMLQFINFKLYNMLEVRQWRIPATDYCFRLLKQLILIHDQC